MKHKILVVEDDPTLREMVAYNLACQGYEVLQVSNGRSAISLAKQELPNLMILDLMLPGIDGFEVCRRLRKEFSFPIIILTARTEEADKVLGLEMGADDYLTKPFSMRELLARVKALLRSVDLIQEALYFQNTQTSRDSQSGQPQPETTLTFGNLEIDHSRREMRLDGQVVHMKPREFDLLLFLARNPGVALSRDLILEQVWSGAYDGNSRTVDVHVRWLREKIEEDPGQSRRIQTVRGIGYRFDG